MNNREIYSDVSIEISNLRRLNPKIRFHHIVGNSGFIEDGHALSRGKEVVVYHTHKSYEPGAQYGVGDVQSCESCGSEEGIEGYKVTVNRNLE